MGTDATTERRGSTGDATELGVSPNVLAALGYVFNLVGALVLLVLEDNDYVRHHAAQALLFTAAVVVARFALGFVGLFLGFLPGGDLLTALLSFAVWAVAGLGFLFLAYKGFTGERYTLPVLGQYIDDVERVF